MLSSRRDWCYLNIVLRAVLLAVALIFAVTSVPDAEARRKPAVTAKKKTVKKRAAKKKPVKKRAKKKRTEKKKRSSSESTEPRRPLP